MAPLVTFKAGRAHRRGDTNWVDPVEGRGLVYLEEADGLLHFCYKNLQTNSTDEDAGGLDLLLFPGDASFSRAKGASGRVNVLKFASSSHRHFFWCQDVDDSKDEEIVKKVNELMGGLEEEEEQAMEVEGEASASGNASSSPPVPASSSGASAAESAQLAQLRSIMAGLTGGAGAGAFGGASQAPSFVLPDVLPTSAANTLLTPSSISQLLPFLPSDIPQTEASLRTAVNSPEFRRSLASLDRALRTGALGPLVQGLGLPERAGVGVEEFLEEVQKQAEREEGGGAGERMDE
ncbi:26S proteasome complex ubiquitin receptor, subunit Rpn13 [Pseudohyphozyma bogoriensis]|nr:26S proteasome complex ubiquitin receptor, subunit Rpn13 [Pseudohyphozyma bogoriensis]